jgi:hypothetical protein
MTDAGFVSLTDDPPLSLGGIQRLFWSLVTHPVGVTQFLEEADDQTRRAITATFDETDNFGLIERLDVYAQGYFFRIRDVLAELFPIVAWRLGEAHFHNLVTDYLLAHPSQDPDLSRIGEALPGYLITHAGVPPELAPIAEIELAIRRALDAPDGTPLNPSDLAGVAPEAWPALTFSKLPHTSLHATLWDYRVLAEMRRQATPPTAELSLSAQLEQTTWLLVWRQGFSVFTRAIDDDEAELFALLSAGQTFDAMCGSAQERGVSEAIVAGYLLRWCEQGLLAARP